MHRRRLLSQFSRAAAVLAWQQVFAAGPDKPSAQATAWTAPSELFLLGVASGEPRPESVVLWTRLATQPLQANGGMPDQPVPVQWTLARDVRCEHAVATGVVMAQPHAAHSVHVEVTGLQPQHTYYYRFEAAGKRSPVGRTRTAPARDSHVSSLRVALASCQHFEAGYFTAHRDIAMSDIDLVAFVGDYIYETELPGYMRVRTHKHQFPINEIDYTLADYRIHHASYKRDADLRACHAAHPWLLVWDDHDVVNDYAGDTDPDLPDMQAFLRLRTAAYQAYFEHLPISPERAPVGPAMRMHANYTWGDLAEFWTVDTRQYRDPHLCEGSVHAPDHGKLLWKCDAALSSNRTMLGHAQSAWLAEGLAGSTCTWKFIVQTTQMSPGTIRSPVGRLLYADGWDAYPAARAALMQAIAQPRVPNVVCLGGDVHRNVVANLRIDPTDLASPIVASEIVGTSITSRGLSEFLTTWLKNGNPDMLHARSDERGYVLLDITPQQVLVDFRSAPHPIRPESHLQTQARYVIDRGVPGPRKV